MILSGVLVLAWTSFFLDYQSSLIHLKIVRMVEDVHTEVNVDTSTASEIIKIWVDMNHMIKVPIYTFYIVENLLNG